MSEFEQDKSLDLQAAVNNRKEELHHGDVVKCDDGTTGIVINEEEDAQRKQSETTRAKNIASAIQTQQKQIEQLKSDSIVDSIGVSEDSIRRERENIERLAQSGNPEAMEHLEAIRKLSAEAEKWEPSMTGIAPAGSEAAQQFKELLKPTENGGFDVSGLDTNALKQNAIDEYNKQQFEQPQVPPNYPSEESLPPQETPVGEVPDQTTFNVPEGQVHSFILTLPKSTRENITRSKSIVVNEVKKKIVPTAVRSITSISEFKHVVKAKNDSEVVSTALPNSGFLATFKGSGSLAMASITPDNEGRVDYAKRYQFCYDNLVTTSIGKLSYTEFCAYVAMADLDLCIFAILRASDPDENKITLICGDEGCRTEYDAKFKYSELMDMDSVSEDTLKQVAEIIQNKDIYENAKAVFQKSPVMSVKTIEIQDNDGATVDIEVKIPSGTTTIERSSKIPEISESKNQFVAGLTMYIPRVYYTIPTNDGTDGNTYEITDTEVIAEIIYNLDDESLQALTQILQDMEQFDSPKFSFKGDFECPVCHRRETNVRCYIDTLIFQKVSRVM